MDSKLRRHIRKHQQQALDIQTKRSYISDKPTNKEQKGKLEQIRRDVLSILGRVEDLIRNL